MNSRLISQWSNTEKVGEALQRSKNYLPDTVGRQIDALVQPESLAMITGTLIIWAGSHFCGVGEIVDVGLLLVGAFFIGWSIEAVARDLYTFGTVAINAKNEADLDRSAKAFAAAVVTGGLTVIMAFLLKRSARQVQVSRGANVRDVTRLRDPGLRSAGQDPYAGQKWSRPSIQGSATMPAGEGATSMFGDVSYSTVGSAKEQQLVRVHELVHRFLSPRLGVFRQFRANLS